MPKSLYIDPDKVLRPEEHQITFPEIPVMQYNKSVKDELADMEAGIRRTMDKGLTPDEMKTAQAAREAVQAASSILSRILN